LYHSDISASFIHSDIDNTIIKRYSDAELGSKIHGRRVEKRVETGYDDGDRGDNCAQ
jgi:hypothetical protein